MTWKAFGPASTTDTVLAGVRLENRVIVVTGCSSGLGFETCRALATHGAHVIGLARTAESARAAASRLPGRITPIACDLGDLESVRAAVHALTALGLPLDAIVANAGVLAGPTRELVGAVEKQLFVNHLGHFALVNGLVPRLRDGSGRVVVVSSSASYQQAPKAGILFDELDGARSYSAFRFYGHAKLANALYAMELGRRLAPRGIAVNALHPGATGESRLNRDLRGPLRFVLRMVAPFLKSVPAAAATQVWLAASPHAEAVTGLWFEDCRPVRGSKHLGDRAMAARLWQLSERLTQSATR